MARIARCTSFAPRASIKAIGVGVNDWSILERFAADGDFDCFMLAGRYTLLDHTALDTFMPDCARRGIGVLMAAPFNSGILATGARPGATYFYQPAEPEIAARIAPHRGGVRAARRGHRRRGAAVSAGPSRGGERGHRHGQRAGSGGESRALPRVDSGGVLGRDEARRTDRCRRAGACNGLSASRASVASAAGAAAPRAATGATRGR